MTRTSSSYRINRSFRTGLSALLLIVPAAYAQHGAATPAEGAVRPSDAPSGITSGEESPADPPREERSPPADEEAKESDEAPKKVVIRATRTQEIGGIVEFEDDEAIVIRTLEGRLESFAKHRVFQIIRLITPEPGQTGTVIRRDGNRQHGIILEDAIQHVRLEIAGVRITIPRTDVHAIVLDIPFKERYERLRVNIDRSTPDQQFQLAQWLRAERRQDLAALELRDILTRFDHEPSRRLLTLIDIELELEAERTARDSAPTDSRGSRRTSSGHETVQRILTDEEVNILRVYEIDFDHPPRVVVPRPTIQKVISNYASDPLLPASEMERNRLFREDPLNIVRLIFELRARELYPEIRVLTEPYAFNLFRQRVHDAWLIPNCATSRCHGGDDAGRLALIGRNTRDVRVRYTNFLILTRLELDDPEWPLLNFQRPLDSLIIQHALPRAVSRRPHPDVPGYTPALQRAEDERLRDFTLFIQALHPRRIAYPIDFEPAPTPGWLARMAGREARDADHDDRDPSGQPGTGRRPDDRVDR